MSWFKKHKSTEERVAVAKSANLEIAVAKNKSNRATEQALRDAKQLKELLERNHFSVTLYIAVGGKPPTQTNRKKHA
jgi:hypothetical protein